ncbi:MAG: peptide-methionine (R)-S-oxide reductase MsrB [Methylophilaceae bacterium]
MNIQRRYFLTAGASFGLLGLSALLPSTVSTAKAEEMEKFEVTRSDAEWKSLLSASAYTILRHEGTEQPYSSPLNSEHRAGIFECAGCAKQLFSSKTKFDSHTGWPSFWQPLEKAVITREDRSLFIARVEVRCSRCGGHLGHVFEDGPKPTGLRYCMNGAAMKFTPSAI